MAVQCIPSFSRYKWAKKWLGKTYNCVHWVAEFPDIQNQLWMNNSREHSHRKKMISINHIWKSQSSTVTYSKNRVFSKLSNCPKDLQWSISKPHMIWSLLYPNILQCSSQSHWIFTFSSSFGLGREMVVMEHTFLGAFALVFPSLNFTYLTSCHHISS